MWNLVLSQAQFALVTELLEREQRHLLVEIRRTHAAAFRHELEHRLETVESILAGMAHSAAAH